MILEFDGIQFGFEGRPLLSGIYMKCETGKITGLLGRNGSGKSTLMKIVFGALACETLSVRINKLYISPPAFTTGKIAYLPQHRFIPSDIPLKKIAQFYEVDANEVVGSFPELEPDMGLNANEVSGGRLRLFEVLLILHSKADFCFLDEPFTGLTPLFVERLREAIRQKSKTKGILISDHLYREVMALAEELYLLTNGKTYTIKTTQDLEERGYLVR